MDKSVLRYQFIAGLRTELKAKVVGCSGDFNELLSKARFDEIRLREVRPERNQEKENEHSSGGRQEPPPAQSTPRNRPSGKGDDTCFFCRGLGHYARECPQKRRGLPVESTGKPGKMRSSGQGKHTFKTVSTVISDRGEDTEQSSVKHPNEPPSPMPNLSIVEEAIQQFEATMHGIEPQDAPNNALLGPTPTSDVLLDLLPVQALLDTGSPITVVSLKCFLRAAAANRAANQSPPQWAKAVRVWLQPSTVTLHSYGGDKLAIVSQVQCKLERGSHIVDTVLQVQEGAPVELLVGTDVLVRLGFGLVRQEGGGNTTNLLSVTPEEKEPTATVKLLHATRLYTCSTLQASPRRGDGDPRGEGRDSIVRTGDGNPWPQGTDHGRCGGESWLEVRLHWLSKTLEWH